jgi:hypothetical protein
MRPGAILTLVMAVVTLCTPAPGLAVQGETVGTAKLTPLKVFPHAHANAVLVVFPHDSEIDFGMKGTPRPHPSGRYFVLWLTTNAGDAWIGGAFPSALKNYQLSTVVPGDKATAEAHLRAAQQLVLTVMSERKAKKLAKRVKRDGFRSSVAVSGKRVVEGPVLPPVVPCSVGICQDPISPF